MGGFSETFKQPLTSPPLVQLQVVSNCPRCQIVHGFKLSWCQIVGGVKLSAVLNCPGVKLSAVSNRFGVKLSWCQLFTPTSIFSHRNSLCFHNFHNLFWQMGSLSQGRVCHSLKKPTPSNYSPFRTFPLFAFSTPSPIIPIQFLNFLDVLLSLELSLVSQWVEFAGLRFQDQRIIPFQKKKKAIPVFY